MRKAAAIFFSLILSAAALSAQTTAAHSTQTARQALYEMFFGKQSGTFLKHLPAITRATLEISGALAGLQQYSLLASQFHTQGSTLQTFETGPVLLTTTDAKTGQKSEFVVDSDTPVGDLDQIQLSIHTYKDGQPQRTPFMPVFLVTMKLESGVWTLNEIGISVKLSLADPDLLKSISDGMKRATAPPQIAMQGAQSQSHIQWQPQKTPTQPPVQMQWQTQNQMPGMPSESPVQSARTFAPDTTALADLRKILAAETTYAATYPNVGFTCALSDLDGFGAAESSEHQAMLISSGLAGGKQHGYAFSLSQCAGAPAKAFHLTATPIGEAFGRRAFCADQSGAVHSSADGNPATCQTSGTPVP